MFIIPGVLISAVTFPGVVVHEFAHYLFCRWTRTQVLAVCFFRFGNPAGYVVHQLPDAPWKSVAISMGPFLINSVVGMAMAFPGTLKLFVLGSPDWLDMVVVWLGLSVGMHAIPSRGDAKSMWSSVSGPRAGLVIKILVLPLVGLVYLMSIASIFWADLIYGAAICLGPPMLLVQLLARN